MTLLSTMGFSTWSSGHFTYKINPSSISNTTPYTRNLVHSSSIPAGNMIDIRTASAADLQKLLTDRKVTNCELVTLDLGQIEKRNQKGMRPHSVISIGPLNFLMQPVQPLDTERPEKSPRGPLRSITILIKVGYKLKGRS